LIAGVMAAVATQFLTHVLIFFQKNPKNREKHRKSKKILFLIYSHHFRIFSIVLKEFKFSNMFGTRSTFNALFLKSLIFLIESMLMSLVLKKNTKK
jgi:hypothetical protein